MVDKPDGAGAGCVFVMGAPISAEGLDPARLAAIDTQNGASIPASEAREGDIVFDPSSTACSDFARRLYTEARPSWDDLWLFSDGKQLPASSASSCVPAANSKHAEPLAACRAESDPAKKAIAILEEAAAQCWVDPGFARRAIAGINGENSVNVKVFPLPFSHPEVGPALAQASEGLGLLSFAQNAEGQFMPGADIILINSDGISGKESDLCDPKCATTLVHEMKHYDQYLTETMGNATDGEVDAHITDGLYGLHVSRATGTSDALNSLLSERARACEESLEDPLTSMANLTGSHPSPEFTAWLSKKCFDLKPELAIGAWFLLSGDTAAFEAQKMRFTKAYIDFRAMASIVDLMAKTTSRDQQEANTLKTAFSQPPPSEKSCNIPPPVSDEYQLRSCAHATDVDPKDHLAIGNAVRTKVLYFQYLCFHGNQADAEEYFMTNLWPTFVRFHAAVDISAPTKELRERKRRMAPPT